MKTYLRLAAFASIFVVSVYAHGEKVHDHRSGKGIVSSSHEAGASEATEVANEPGAGDKGDKVHDHRKMKGLP